MTSQWNIFGDFLNDVIKKLCTNEKVLNTSHQNAYFVLVLNSNSIENNKQQEGQTQITYRPHFFWEADMVERIDVLYL